MRRLFLLPPDTRAAVLRAAQRRSGKLLQPHKIGVRAWARARFPVSFQVSHGWPHAHDKLFDAHVVRTESDGTALLYIDRHLVHEVTSPQAFEG